MAALSSLESLKASSRVVLVMDSSSVACGVLEQIDERSAVAVRADHSVLSCHTVSFANKKSPGRDFRN